MMKKGFIMITVLAVLIMIAVGAAAIMQSTGSLTALKINNVEDIKAQYLAEAGIQRAIWLCRTAACASEAAYTIDGRTVAITVTDLGSGNTQIQTTVNYTDA